MTTLLPSPNQTIPTAEILPLNEAPANVARIEAVAVKTKAAAIALAEAVATVNPAMILQVTPSTLLARNKEEIAEYMAKKAQKKAEIEKVKKRREGRALERAKHEEEMIRDRLHEGRMKPIDVLSKHLNGSDVMDIELNEPYMVFKSYFKLLLTLVFDVSDSGLDREMEELRDDVKMHVDLDRATPTHIVYWELLPLSSLFMLAEARKKDAFGRARVGGEEPHAELLAEERGLHSSIEADVKNLLEGNIQQGEDRLESDHGLRPGEEDSDHDVGDAETYSPEPILQEDSQGDENEEAIDHEEDRAILESNRMAVKQQTRMQEAMASKPTPSEDNFEVKAMKAMRAMEEGDAVFGSGAEVNLDSQRKAPVYAIGKDGNSLETCIIRFHAGPPYEDIAFWSVNKEWEYSHKKGFKFTFERGILHVYVNFKRYCYRR
ncbi:hypothetical protein CRYUN_Cryun05aG0230000 [Craigia yunnanensis]